MKAKSIRGNSPEEIKSTLVAAAVFGLDVTVLGLFFLILIPYVFLEHTNIRFPGWLDKTIGLIFTTPNIHKVHHERDQYYTDSNYSDIFIIWDRIFGTFVEENETVRYGIITPLTSYNPLWINSHGWAETWTAMRTKRTLRGKMRCVFGAPAMEFEERIDKTSCNRLISN